MKIIKLLLLFCFCVGLIATSLAQVPHKKNHPAQEKRDEIKAQKSAYITAKLNLTAQEAQQFWPLYNEFDSKQDALNKVARELMRTAGEAGDNMTDAQATQLINEHIANRKKEVELEQEYAAKFKTSIGAIKTVQLRLAEQDFNREVLRRLKESGSRSEHSKYKGSEN